MSKTILLKQDGLWSVQRVLFSFRDNLLSQPSAILCRVLPHNPVKALFITKKGKRTAKLFHKLSQYTAKKQSSSLYKIILASKRDSSHYIDHQIHRENTNAKTGTFHHQKILSTSNNWRSEVKIILKSIKIKQTTTSVELLTSQKAQENDRWRMGRAVRFVHLFYWE